MLGATTFDQGEINTQLPGKTPYRWAGMGLGLSISYGLVQSFGGKIRGANASEGGAVLTVELENWAEEAAA